MESLPPCNIRMDRIEEKLDMLIRMVGNLGGLRGFGLDILANFFGNKLTRM